MNERDEKAKAPLFDGAFVLRSSFSSKRHTLSSTDTRRFGQVTQSVSDVVEDSQIEVGTPYASFDSQRIAFEQVMSVREGEQDRTRRVVLVNTLRMQLDLDWSGALSPEGATGLWRRCSRRKS